MREPRRVVVTGLGAVTSLGRDVEDIWDAVAAGRSGISYIRQFDSSAFPVRIGGEVDIEALRSDPRMSLPETSRSIQFALWAAERAWIDAGLETASFDPGRAGVCIGASTFPVIEDKLADPSRMLDGDLYNFPYYMEVCRSRPDLLAQRDLGSISTAISHAKGLGHTSLTVQTACASATQAIGEAYSLLRYGDVDFMLTGGADSMMTVPCVAGFTLARALSRGADGPERASRPFDARRDGFVLAEGAGLLVLEGLDHARARGAQVHAELIGYGSSSDGYRFTDVHPEGAGAIAAMRNALRSAGIEPRDVGYINAHGTSTLQNDLTETRAIREVFRDDVPWVSSTKSQLGHLVCAAGGIEALLCVQALKHSLVPPTINYENPDPMCDLDYVPNEARPLDLEIALSNSFGFGGQNGTVLLKRWRGE